MQNMIYNTGNISFALYGFFIIITVLGMAFLMYIIIKGTLDNEKITKMTEVFKYAIVTTAIATVTLIVSDLFKERDYDKNEMQAFNAYIPYIMDTVGTIDHKINFCRFFASVTPKSELKDGWHHYLIYLEDEKKKVLSIDERIQQKAEHIENKETPPSDAEMASIELDEIEKQKILSNLNATENTSYLVVFGADASLREAKHEIAWAAAQINQSAAVYKKGKWYRTVIPVNKDWKLAKDISASIQKASAGSKKAYVVSVKSWCSSIEYSAAEECMICN